jgi:hypothetical protein
MLVATLDYAVSAAEFRIKCRRELKLSVGKYLETGRPTLLLVVELEDLRETVRISIRMFTKLVPCQHGHVHCVPSHHDLVLSYFLVTATSWSGSLVVTVMWMGPFSQWSHVSWASCLHCLMWSGSFVSTASLKSVPCQHGFMCSGYLCQHGLICIGPLVTAALSEVGPLVTTARDFPKIWNGLDDLHSCMSPVNMLSTLITDIRKGLNLELADWVFSSRG